MDIKQWNIYNCKTSSNLRLARGSGSEGAVWLRLRLASTWRVVDCLPNLRFGFRATLWAVVLLPRPTPDTTAAAPTPSHRNLVSEFEQPRFEGPWVPSRTASEGWGSRGERAPLTGAPGRNRCDGSPWWCRSFRRKERSTVSVAWTAKKPTETEDGN